ncbi:Replication factor C (RF-C) subunit [Globomyces sp. JEL0801]|nr:Replication factor C (RF-C) subunit [Globomyces sp. JEL0801]
MCAEQGLRNPVLLDVLRRSNIRFLTPGSTLIAPKATRKFLTKRSGHHSETINDVHYTPMFASGRILDSELEKLLKFNQSQLSYVLTPPEFVGKTFGQLYKSLCLNNGIIPIGILREVDPILRNKLPFSNSKDFPHLLVYGPSGVGKKTRINAILNELYGVHFDKLKVELKQFTTPSNKKLEINVISSNYHIEITPSDLGIYDQVVIQDLIKELAQTRQIDSNSKHKFKIVVFNEADSLSRNAQSALRRTMEKYMGNMRVILCCNMISKILGPIRSRCLLVRIPAPAEDELSLPQSIASKIAIECDGNMRKALLMLEAHYVQQ